MEAREGRVIGRKREREREKEKEVNVNVRVAKQLSAQKLKSAYRVQILSETVAKRGVPGR